ncbi:hypothetical protein [Chishuiella changwenlii]|uniref:hypothetical protein n=1 Tax=Chishuiella changwenlii TaxID=1434701 RepID=UPI002FDAF9CB
MQATSTVNIKKGRNEHLIADRNKLLTARFYYYSTLNGLKFSKCLENLEKEFFISQSRIADLLAQHTDYISLLEKENYSLQTLKDYFPFMSWQYHHGKMSQTGGQLFLDLV